MIFVVAVGGGGGGSGGGGGGGSGSDRHGSLSGCHLSLVNTLCVVLPVVVRSLEVAYWNLHV